MNGWDTTSVHTLDLPFNLYTCNVLIARLVDEVRSAEEPLRILDVGGRGRHLKDFLVQDELHTLDILPPEDNRTASYVLGNVVYAPFKSGSFDIVVASDVYEHIPIKDRLKAVAEMLRLSKNFVVLASPFHSREVEEAEISVNNFFLKATGTPHSWLKEHIENRLPLDAKLESFLHQAGYELHKLRSNNISNWLLLQLFIFYANAYETPLEKIMEVHRFYNQNFMQLGDFLDPTYRKIYLVGRRGTLPELGIKQDKNIDKFKRQQLTFLVFDAIKESTASRDKQLNRALQNKDAEIRALEAQIEQMQRGVAMQLLGRYRKVVENYCPGVPDGGIITNLC